MNIEDFLNLDNYANNIRLSRRKANIFKAVSTENTQEFFTPYRIIKKMMDKIPEENWSDPSKTFFEPCFGNGQFIIYIIWNRVQHGIDWKTTLSTLYGIEMMEDNVMETKLRVIDLLNEMQIDFDNNEALSIMDNNLVCSDYFSWDIENWCSK